MFTGIVNSTSFNNLKSRFIKFTGWGKNDVKNHIECMPYGLDSNPIKNMVAVYIQNASGQLVVTGYINVNQLADVGEFRCYSTDSDGNLKGQVWLKNDGSAQSTQNCSPAVLGDKNKTALTDFYNLANEIMIFTNNCMDSTSDPTLVIAATDLNTYISGVIQQIQQDINETESTNVALN
jgi:hypothetical protein